MQITYYLFQQLQNIIKNTTSNTPVPQNFSEKDLETLQFIVSQHHIRLIFAHLFNKEQLVFYFQRYLLLTQETTFLIKYFQQFNLDIIILKGIPLNMQLYQQRYLRETRDIDCLISKKDLLIYHHHLLKLGYQLNSSLPSPEYWFDKYPFISHYFYQLPYFHPDKKICVQIKWGTSADNVNGMHWIDYSKIDTIYIQNTAIKTLTVEQNFFYLCDHGAKHCWEHIKWLVDLAVIWKNNRVNWSEITELTELTQSIRPVLEASILLQRHLNITLSPITHSYIDKWIVYFRLFCIQKTWFSKIPTKSKKRIYAGIVLNFFLYPGVNQKIHFLVRTLLSRVESQKIIYQFNKKSAFKIFIALIISIIRPKFGIIQKI